MERGKKFEPAHLPGFIGNLAVLAMVVVVVLGTIYAVVDVLFFNS